LNLKLSERNLARSNSHFSQMALEYEPDCCIDLHLDDDEPFSYNPLDFNLYDPLPEEEPFDAKKELPLDPSLTFAYFNDDCFSPKPLPKQVTTHHDPFDFRCDEVLSPLPPPALPAQTSLPFHFPPPPPAPTQTRVSEPSTHRSYPRITVLWHCPICKPPVCQQKVFSNQNAAYKHVKERQHDRSVCEQVAKFFAGNCVCVISRVRASMRFETSMLLQH
jgi:hypothetical protein